MPQTAPGVPPLLDRDRPALPFEPERGARLASVIGEALRAGREVVLIGRAISEGPEVLAGHAQPYLLPGEFIDLQVRARLAARGDA